LLDERREGGGGMLIDARATRERPNPGFSRELRIELAVLIQRNPVSVFGDDVS
jgi:hypothetical protein